MLFVWRDFVAQYKQTILGPLWHIIQPLFTTLLFTLVFGQVAKLPTDELPPLLFYMAGITCWNYFADCLNRSAGTFTRERRDLRQGLFPPPLRATLRGHLQYHQVRHPVRAVLLVFMGFYSSRGARRSIRTRSCCCAGIAAADGRARPGRWGSSSRRSRSNTATSSSLVTFGVQLLMYSRAGRVSPLDDPAELPLARAGQSHDADH